MLLRIKVFIFVDGIVICTELRRILVKMINVIILLFVGL
jgi:hypothetical protein